MSSTFWKGLTMSKHTYEFGKGLDIYSKIELAKKNLQEMKKQATKAAKAEKNAAIIAEKRARRAEKREMYQAMVRQVSRTLKALNFIGGVQYMLENAQEEAKCASEFVVRFFEQKRNRIGRKGGWTTTVSDLCGDVWAKLVQIFC